LRFPAARQQHADRLGLTECILSRNLKLRHSTANGQNLIFTKPFNGAHGVSVLVANALSSAAARVSGWRFGWSEILGDFIV
jgi:hypothetical protein